MKYLFVCALLLICLNCKSQYYIDSAGAVLIFDKPKAECILDNNQLFKKGAILDSLESLIKSIKLSDQKPYLQKIRSMDTNQYYSIPLDFWLSYPDSQLMTIINLKLEEDLKNLLFLKYKVQNNLTLSEEDTSIYLYYLLMKNSLSIPVKSLWPFEYYRKDSNLIGDLLNKSHYEFLPSPRLQIIDVVFAFHDSEYYLFMNNYLGKYRALQDEKFIYILFRQRI